MYMCMRPGRQTSVAEQCSKQEQGQYARQTSVAAAGSRKAHDEPRLDHEGDMTHDT